MEQKDEMWWMKGIWNLNELWIPEVIREILFLINFKEIN